MNKFIEPTFKVNKKDLKNNFVEFELEPLVEGFAVTLGNTLRRVLLSVIPGSAIFAFKINGIVQELQTLPGCLENVVQINLNIQKIKIKVEPNIYKKNEIIDLKLNANKIGVIKAGDIETPAGVSIINTESKLFEITKPNTEILIDFKVKQSYGFSTFEENKNLIEEIGWIYLTSNFSPIENVEIFTDEVKVGEKDVLEKLVLSIKTNGTITPIEALSQASEILCKHFEFIKELAPNKFEKFDFSNFEEEVVEEEEIEIAELDFSERTYNALTSFGIKKVSQLSEKTLTELKTIKNIGDKSINEISEKLKDECNITLKK